MLHCTILFTSLCPSGGYLPPHPVLQCKRNAVSTIAVNTTLHLKGHLMYPFPPEVTPAVRSHLNAQFAFAEALSRSMTQSLQNLYQLNVELGRSLLQESAAATQQFLTTRSPTDAISAATARAQPASQTVLAYQRYVSKVAADTQVELARVSEQHVQETSRTARVLVDEVNRVTADETERRMRQQQEMLAKVGDPFESLRAQAGSAFARTSASMQSAAPGASMQAEADRTQAGESVQRNVQDGQTDKPAQPARAPEAAASTPPKGGGKAR